MFGCANNSLYFICKTELLLEMEEALNDAVLNVARRSAISFKYKELKRLPYWGHYIKIPTKYYLKTSEDLEYCYEELSVILLDEEFCENLVIDIAGKKINKRNLVLRFSCLTGRRFGKNYLIIYWR